MLVKRGAAFNRLKTNDTCMVCEECVDPPAVTRMISRRSGSASFQLTLQLESLDRPPCAIASRAASPGISLTIVSKDAADVISQSHKATPSPTCLWGVLSNARNALQPTPSAAQERMKLIQRAELRR